MRFGCGIVLGMFAALATGCSKSQTGAVGSADRGHAASSPQVQVEPPQIDMIYPLAGALFPPEPPTPVRPTPALSPTGAPTLGPSPTPPGGP